MTEDRAKERSGESDGLARLLRAAGRRPEPPPGAYEEALAAATASWQKKVARRRMRLRLAGGATAAVLVCGIALVALFRPEPTVVAQTDRVVGRVEWQATAGAGWSPLAITEDEALTPGVRLRTAEDGYAGLRMLDGSSLRLAPGSEIELTSDREVTLVSGKLYVDSGRPVPNPETPLEIVTEVGRAVEVGTQYEISYGPGRPYRLRVREGLVRLLRHDATLESSAGEELLITADGEISESPIDPAADSWDWIFAVAPVPVVDSRPVTLLLEWVARETGRPLRYAPPGLRERAMRTTLHGRIGALTPLEALGVLLATTDLEYAILEDGTIEIRTRNGT